MRRYRGLVKARREYYCGKVAGKAFRPPAPIQFFGLVVMGCGCVVGLVALGVEVWISKRVGRAFDVLWLGVRVNNKNEGEYGDVCPYV